VICSRAALLSALLLLALAADPAAAVTWSRTYGSQGGEVAEAIRTTSDGGCVVAGATQWAVGRSLELTVLKTDRYGTLEWARAYGPGMQASEMAYCIRETADGGYVVAGHTETWGAGEFDAWVLKLDSSGSPLWQRSYGGTGSDLAYAVRELPAGGGYVLAAHTQSFSSGGWDVWVVRLDLDGGILWEFAYGGPGSDYSRGIALAPDGGFFIGGTTESFGQGETDLWLLRLDSSGAVVWQKALGGGLYDQAQGVESTSDGGYVVTGSTQSFGLGADLWVVKVDDLGAIEWQRRFDSSASEAGIAIRQTGDGGHLVSGYTDTGIFGDQDAWILRLDASGDLQWQGVYGGAGFEWMESVDIAGDGGYLAAGFSPSFTGERDWWVMKLAPDGLVDGSCGFPLSPPVTVTETTAVVTDTTAVATASAAVITVTDAVAEDPGLSVQEQCSDSSCAELACRGVVAAPDPACEGDVITFTLDHIGGEGSVTVEWDLDGDTVVDDSGNPVTASPGIGDWGVTATAIDSCQSPGPQECTAGTILTVNPNPVPAIVPSGPTSFCFGMLEIVLLEVQPGWASYTWYRGTVELQGVTGSSCFAFESGEYTVTVTDENGCEGTSEPIVVDAEYCPPPEEVSDTRNGEAPLRVFPGGMDVRVGEEPKTTAYNVYADELGSWYAPGSATGSACTLTTWTDNGDGTLTLEYGVPGGAWIVVTASNPYGEGPSGSGSAGEERTTLGSWELCGPAP
jgi:hypothetical protein